MRSKKKFVLAANWKMYKSPRETEQFFKEFLDYEKKMSANSQCIFFVPAIDLMCTAQCLANSKILWGAQNIYFESEGAFTGENSPKVLKDIGSQVCLVGHSERRNLFAESNEDCAKKIRSLQALGLAPMLCVGESLEQRKAGQTFSVITEQLKKALEFFDLQKKIYIAYEPVWAIGTGQVATAEQANEAHLILRKSLNDIYGKDLAEETPILYGGSVKPENAKELARQEQIDGFLVGGASLKAESLSQIAQHSFA
jgi:triosephosphate isomerase